MSARGALDAAAPLLFVLIWSTGWIAAGYAAPHADPLTFLCVRFVAAGLVLAGFAAVTRAAWPRGRAAGHAMISGMLLHGLYLGGVWWAIAHGVPAGVSGIVAGLQPVLTAVLAPWLVGEAVPRAARAGIGLGFLGVALVIAPKFAGVSGLDGLALPLAVNLAATLSVTLGTFYQKRHLGAGDLRTMTCLQYLGALVVVLPGALTLEQGRFEVVPATLLALAWSVLVLSIGAIALLLTLLRRGAVTRAASLIYLVPPITAFQAWLAFGETLGPVQLAGTGLTVLAVILVARGTRGERARD